MRDAAIVLALLGLTVGIFFRLKILLLSLGPVLIVSVAFSWTRGFTFWEAALAVLVAQGVFQSGYFLGLVLRAIADSFRGRPPGP